MDITGAKRRGSPRYEHFVIKLYNSICQGDPVQCIEEIPQEAREVLAYMDYHDLVKPFVAIDIRDGLSRDQASIKYGVTPGFAREVGRRFGFLPRRKRSLITEETVSGEET